MTIHFGNAFGVVIRGMKKADDLSVLTSAVGTAQLKTQAGAAIGDPVSFVHSGGGDYRAEFASSYFTDNAVALAIGELITIEIVGSAPNFRFDVVHRVKSRG